MKRVALRRKDGDGHGSKRAEERGRPKQTWWDRVRDDFKEKGMFGKEVYDRIYRQASTPHQSGNCFSKLN